MPTTCITVDSSPKSGDLSSFICLKVTKQDRVCVCVCVYTHIYYLKLRPVVAAMQQINQTVLGEYPLYFFLPSVKFISNYNVHLFFLYLFIYLAGAGLNYVMQDL